MAKKSKESKTALANVLPSSSINSTVNLSLSKQDIIDMAVDEHEQQLELMEHASQMRLHRARVVMAEIKNDNMVLLEGAILQKNKDLVAVLAKRGVTLKVMKTSNYNRDENSVVVKTGYDSMYLAVKGKVTSDESCGYVPEVPKWEDQEIKETKATTYLNGTPNKKANSGIQITIKGEMNRDFLKNLEERAKVALEELSLAFEERNLHLREKKSLDKMGARAKSQLVRKMLQESPEGKAIIASMPKLSMLLPAPKAD